MISENILQTAFAWYRNPAYLEGSSKACTQNGCSPHLFCPKDRLLPFQIRIPKIPGTPLDILGWDLLIGCVTNYMDIQNNIPALAILQDSDFHYIIYKAETNLEWGEAPADPLSIFTVLDMPPGIYNSRINTNYGPFYSEPFCPKTTDELNELYKVEWWNSCDFTSEGAQMFYSTGFKNLVYLDAEMVAPKLEIDEENEKDGFGNAVPTLQRFIWRHRLSSAQLLHSAAVGLSTIPLHSDNKITLPDGRTTKMLYVKADPAFQDCGALLTLEFQEISLIKSGCCGS